MGSRAPNRRQDNALGSHDAVLFWIFQVRRNLHPVQGQLRHHQQHDFLRCFSGQPGRPSCIQVLLKKSKTDQLRQGTLVCLGKTGRPLCPVAALLSWLVRRGNDAGPLFRYANGAPLTQSNFTAEFRRALQRIGVNPYNYSGHSFRVGAATTAASQGIGDATIKLLGRCSAYQIYMRTPLAPLTSSLAGLPRISETQ